MKKIGIITVPDYDNYGNRLQNFAVKEFFSQMGYAVDTLELNDVEFSKYRIRKIKLSLKKFRLRPIVYMFEFLNGKSAKVSRYRKFECFTEKHLNVKYYPNGKQKKLKKISDKYDYIVLGSDQIWHPTVMTTPNLFFATFAEPEKVLFFAPSFGLDSLSDVYAQKVRSGLLNKNNITVREDSGRKIINELVGKEATVLPDPTLCISVDSWKKLTFQFNYSQNKPYILKYFLGNESEVYKREFHKIKDEHNCDILEIGNKGGECGYITGPQEFLGAIMNAEYVITDSFHAVVFCIIFHKPFTVFSRLNKMNEKEGLDSRIDGLLEKFGMQNRKFSSCEKKSVDVVDFSKCKEILDSIRHNTEEYFENIMTK